MKYPKLREIKEALVSLFSRPYTTAFPAKPHTPANKFRGKPVVDDKNCVGCLTCANVCPPAAITYQDDAEKKVRTIRRDYGLCIFCGQCETHCITHKGVILSDKIYEMSVFDRSQLVEEQQKELLVCESCGAIITTKEHFIYLYNKLGPKAFSSVLNLNLLNERLQLAAEEEVKTGVRDGLQRKDLFNTICPNCLRLVQVKILT